jgi:hypothetical protein
MEDQKEGHDVAKSKAEAKGFELIKHGCDSELVLRDCLLGKRTNGQRDERWKAEVSLKRIFVSQFLAYAGFIDMFEKTVLFE